MSSVEIYMEGNDLVVEDDEQRRKDHGDDSLEGEDSLDDDYELSWRLDPQRSLSDWTVEVVTKGTKNVDVYHVHKSVLAVGPRRSNYFAATFREQASPKSSPSRPKFIEKFGNDSPNDPCDFGIPKGLSNNLRNGLSNGLTRSLSPMNLLDFVDSASAISRIELEKQAAEAFPVVLDFLYSTNGDLAITTKNAVALHHLSERLEMKLLRRKVNEFWEKDLSMENLVTYYQNASVFNDQVILQYSEEHCAEHIFEVRENAVVEILTVVDPEFFLRVVAAADIGEGKAASLRMSLLVAVYCNIHKSELDKNMFLRLTAPGHLPTMEVKAARVLLELEDDICGDNSTMTSLKDRAIPVLASHWDDACVNGKSGMNVNLPRLAGPALDKFVEGAFANAKERLNAVESIRRRNEELESQKSGYAALQAQLQQAKEEVEKLRKQNDEIERKCKKEFDTLRQHNEELQEQLTLAQRQVDIQKDQLKLRKFASGNSSDPVRSTPRE